MSSGPSSGARSLPAVDPVSLVLQVEIPAAPAMVSTARDFVVDALNSQNSVVPASVLWIAGLVTSELVTNAVIHARTPVRVGVSCSNRSVLIAVSDHATAPLWEWDEQERNESGRGMAIVASIADDFGWFVDPEGGKTIWAILNFDD